VGFLFLWIWGSCGKRGWCILGFGLLPPPPLSIFMNANESARKTSTKWKIDHMPICGKLPGDWETAMGPRDGPCKPTRSKSHAMNLRNRESLVNDITTGETEWYLDA